MLAVRPTGFSDAVHMSFGEFVRRLAPRPDHEKCGEGIIALDAMGISLSLAELYQKTDLV